MKCTINPYWSASLPITGDVCAPFPQVLSQLQQAERTMETEMALRQGLAEEFEQVSLAQLPKPLIPRIPLRRHVKRGRSLQALA